MLSNVGPIVKTRREVAIVSRTCWFHGKVIFHGSGIVSISQGLPSKARFGASLAKCVNLLQDFPLIQAIVFFNAEEPSSWGPTYGSPANPTSAAAPLGTKPLLGGRGALKHLANWVWRSGNSAKQMFGEGHQTWTSAKPLKYHTTHK